MLNWVEYRKELLGRIGEVGQIAPDTVKGYKTPSTATTGGLDTKTRELTALAVAVTTRCDGCITVHMAEAVKHDATREEVVDALNVATSLNAEVVLVYSTRVSDMMQTYERT